MANEFWVVAETRNGEIRKVTNEIISEARRLYTKHNWPVINVSRKSIEETAAQIIQLYQRREDQDA